MFVDDIDKTLSSHIQKSVDDYKVYNSVPSATDIAILQQAMSVVQRRANGQRAHDGLKRRFLNVMCPVGGI